MTLKRPVAVFDAGIGSYAIARKIADRFPDQDVLYFADRANFPYGGKSRAELLAVMRSTIERLESHDPAAIVIASNAPSVMVLDDLKALSRTPLIGVFPPVRRALDASVTKRIAVLGVASLIASPEIRAYVEREAAGQGLVELVAASDLVELVENGAFLTDGDWTLAAVRAKLEALHPDTDVATLSSTHLPWLVRYFEQATRLALSRSGGRRCRRGGSIRKQGHGRFPDAGVGAARLRSRRFPTHAGAPRT